MNDKEHGDVRAKHLSDGMIVFLCLGTNVYMIGVGWAAMIVLYHYGLLGMGLFIFVFGYLLLLLLHYATRAKRPDML